MSVETDQVLSAIRRGEDSLPRLRAATGLEYAQLHPILYKLEYGWKSIHRSETADGFDRYVPTASEKTGKTNGNGATAPTVQQAIPPSAYSQTKLGNQARAASLVQRDAPYCVGCRGVCLFVIDGDRLQWKCRPCDVLFEGSTFQVAHIEPDPEPRPAMRERVSLGPEEEETLANMRVRTDHPPIGDEEEAALAAMRGGELSEEEARIAEEIDRELAESVDPVLVDAADDEEIEHWRSGMCRKCGAPAVSKTGNICAAHQAIDDAVVAPCKRCGAPTTAKIRNRRLGHCAECYKTLMRERREQNKTARQSYVDTPKKICGCGRELPHNGRCSARRGVPKATTANRPNGRPRIQVDLQKFESLLADPRLSINEVCEGAGINRNLIYTRKDVDPEFGAAYQRGMDRREQAIADGKPKTPEGLPEKLSKSPQIITKPITSKEHNEDAERTVCGRPDGGRRDFLETRASEMEGEARGNVPELPVRDSHGPRRGVVAVPGEDLSRDWEDLSTSEQESEASRLRFLHSESTTRHMGHLDTLLRRPPSEHANEEGKTVSGVEGRFLDLLFGPNADRIRRALAVQTRAEIETEVRCRQSIHEEHAARRVARSEIKPAWSPGFEKEVGDPEGGIGLTLFYLISLLHHDMEPHEQEAVWTLVRYIKRMEA